MEEEARNNQIKNGMSLSQKVPSQTLTLELKKKNHYNIAVGDTDSHKVYFTMFDATDHKSSHNIFNAKNKLPAIT